MELPLEASHHVALLFHRIPTLPWTFREILHVGPDALIERLVFLNTNGAGSKADCGMDAQELVNRHAIQITTEFGNNFSKRGYIVRTRPHSLLWRPCASEVLASKIGELRNALRQALRLSGATTTY